jgi:hypothetical protein
MAHHVVKPPSLPEGELSKLPSLADHANVCPAPFDCFRQIYAQAPLKGRLFRCQGFLKSANNHWGLVKMDIKEARGLGEIMKDLKSQ